MATQPQSSATAETLIDIREWAALEGPPAFELVGGRLEEKPDVALWHEVLLMNFVRFLLNYVEENRMGQIVSGNAKLRISAISGRMPDVFSGNETFGPTLFPGLEIPLGAVWPVEFAGRTDD